MEPNHYAELKETIPTTSPEWKRTDNARRETQRVEAIRETMKIKARRGLSPR